MERQEMSEESITVTEFKGGGQRGQVLDDGTYEAEYKRMKIFMDNTPWGEKKSARLYFEVTSGKYRGEATSFKGTFFLDSETQAWVVGSKSKLAEAIRAITGGNSISPANAGTKVFVVVQGGVSKKTQNAYSFVKSIIPRPAADDGQTLTQQAEATQAPVAQTSQAQPTKPVIPAAAKQEGEGLLSDLTELSDFSE